jgi:triosephosphate isomerase
MKKLMAANWKMFKTRDEAARTSAELVEALSGSLPVDREVLVFPPFTAIESVAKVFEGAKGFAWGGQNFYPADNGAYTGEIAPAMLRELNCQYLLAGHSERRQIFGETDALINEKVRFGLSEGFRVVLCIGETIDERKSGRVEEVLARQLNQGLEGVATGFAPAVLSVAYEPVWAIGTGAVAGPAEILDAHAFIRSVWTERYGDTAAEMRLLYGGSVKPENATEIISLDNVDGVLVGGASLRADSFAAIVAA